MPVKLDHWAAHWRDTTELQDSYEVVFAAEHNETGTVVRLVPVEAGCRGALDVTERRGREYRRVVRPCEGAPALSEHTTTYGSACKARARELTLKWLDEHRDGLAEGAE